MSSTNPCPVCRKEARGRIENSAFPFCSARCKLVDLGSWLDGAYRVPTDEAPLGIDGSDESKRDAS
jgi:uncharacterized protein